MRVEPFWLPLGPEHHLVLSKQETELLQRASALLDKVRERVAKEYGDSDTADEAHEELASASAFLGEVVDRYGKPGCQGKLHIHVPDPQ